MDKVYCLDSAFDFLVLQWSAMQASGNFWEIVVTSTWTVLPISGTLTNLPQTSQIGSFSMALKLHWLMIIIAPFVLCQNHFIPDITFCFPLKQFPCVHMHSLTLLNFIALQLPFKCLRQNTIKLKQADTQWSWCWERLNKWGAAFYGVQKNEEALKSRCYHKSESVGRGTTVAR